MSEKQPETLTHYAMLVAWEQFAQRIGMIRTIEAVALHQKTVDHSSWTKACLRAGPFLFKTNGRFNCPYRLLKMLFFDV